MKRSSKAIVLGAGIMLLLSACGPGAQATATATPGGKATPTSPTAPTVTATPRAATPGLATPTPAATATPAASKPKYGGTIRVATQDPPTWNPHDLGGQEGLRMVHNLVFSNLATLPARRETECRVAITPEAAESWRWVDDKTLDLRIHKGIKYHDSPPVNGREMTSEDVVTSLKAAYGKPVRLTATVGQNLQSLEATSPYEVRFTMKVPTPSLTFGAGLANHFGVIIYPKEVNTPQYPWEKPDLSYIGSGPFMFGSWVPGVKVTLQRNPGYFKPGLPYVDSLELVIVTEVSTRKALLDAGKLDIWLDTVPVEFVPNLEANPKLNIKFCPGTNPQLLQFRSDQPPLDDVRVRRAISLALDRDTWLKVLYGDRGVKMVVLGPQVHPLYVTEDELPGAARQYLKRDVAAAKRLLVEAGYSQGLDLTLNTSRSLLYDQRIPETVIAMLGEAGIRAKLNIMEAGAYSASVYGRGDYKDVVHTFLTADYGFDNLLRFHSKAPTGLNISHVRDPELDKMLDEYAVTVDEKKLKALATRIQARILEQVYVVAGPIRNEYAATQKWVKDFYLGTNGAGIRFSSTWAELVWLEK